jgi:branched-chain amino acid transport system ATP-binding protein
VRLGANRNRSAVESGRWSLEVQDASVSFDGLAALVDVTLHVERGEILGLIGPNGAGKTTLVNVITGYTRLQSGRVYFGGRDVTGHSPDALARAGLARTFQSVRLFDGLTVAENVEAAVVAMGGGRGRARKSVDEILEQLHLDDYRDALASALPYGLERRLAVARAIASRPRLLMLDEPAAGLNDTEKAEHAKLIESVRGTTGCGVLIIEHDMRMIASLCDRVQVLASGRVLAVGTPAEVSQDAAVVEAFLGKEAALEWAQG